VRSARDSSTSSPRRAQALRGKQLHLVLWASPSLASGSWLQKRPLKKGPLGRD
jgi:hypothetical protein